MWTQHIVTEGMQKLAWLGGKGEQLEIAQEIDIFHNDNPKYVLDSETYKILVRSKLEISGRI